MTGTLSRSETETIGRLDAIGQAELVASGQLTVEDLVVAAIQRVERLNPTLNAVITPLFDHAVDAARAGLPAGPFTGVPYLVKDLAAEIDGVRCCEGSAYLRNNISTGDQVIVSRLKRAGLAILGKTNTPEFGMVPTTEPALFGATANPWDIRRTPGGSSGGSAAAVAVGMVPAAHGNDVGGSIRIPASCCGLFGFKPTRGHVPWGPRYGDVFSGLGAEHALTRSVRDSAALLDAVAGPDLGDPYLAPAADGPFLAQVSRPPGRLRLAYTTRTPDGRPVHPDCVAALCDAVALCAELGHEVVERDMDELTPDIGTAIGIAYGAAMTWVIDYWARVLGRPPERTELEPFTWAFWEQGREVSGGAYLLAITDLQAFSRRIAAAFTGFDAWLSPTLAQPPIPLGEIVSTATHPLRGAEAAANLVAFPLIVANITGGPAMSVPLTWSIDGLPIGVHVLGRYGHDATLFRLAGQLERARPWAGRWPSLIPKESR